MFSMPGMKQVLSKILNSEAMGELTHILAKTEVEQVRRMKRLEDAVGVDHIRSVPEVDDREDALRAAIEGILNDDFERVWIEHTLEADDVEEVRPYLGMEPDEWRDQIEEWAATYRSRAEFPEKSDGDLAAMHVENKFGVDMDHFERTIIDYDRGSAAQRTFLANFGAVSDGIDLVYREVSEDGGELA